MSESFIEFFTIVRSEFIECLCMESSLISYIHRIINDDNREYKTNEKHITPWTILDTHRCCKWYNKCWVRRRHTTTSEHIGKTKSSLSCMNNTLEKYSNEKRYKWNQECVWEQVCLELIEHTEMGYWASVILYSFFPAGATTDIVSPTFFPMIALPIGDSLLILPSRIDASCEPTIV